MELTGGGGPRDGRNPDGSGRRSASSIGGTRTGANRAAPWEGLRGAAGGAQACSCAGGAAQVLAMFLVAALCFTGREETVVAGHVGLVQGKQGATGCLALRAAHAQKVSCWAGTHLSPGY